MTRKNIAVHLISLCVLSVGFLLCRYVFFDIHGMYDWPLLLFLFGLLVIVLSFFAKARLVPIATSFGYTVGFLAGVVFQTDGVDPGGGSTNSLWIIWTAVFVCVVLLSVFMDLTVAVKRKFGQTRA